MGHLELEVKVLNIEVEKLCEVIEGMGGKLIQNVKQQLYTYDLPTIYGRYCDLLYQLQYPESNNKYITTLDKMKILLFELDNLMNNEEKEYFNSIIKINYIDDIACEDEIVQRLSDKKILEFMKKFQVNPNKWIRLRKTNEKVTLATKHILAENGTALQQMLETEIEVSSFEGTNDLLIQLGFYFKSYQEKKRISYQLFGQEIDIDFWPGIPPFMEIEGKNETEIAIFLEKLGYNMADTVSCTADEVYRLYGKSMFDTRKLKFD